MSKDLTPADLQEKAEQLYEELSEAQQLWLDKTVESYRDSPRASKPKVEHFKARLIDEIPPDFDPSSISIKLVSPFDEPTPLGIVAVEENPSFIEDMRVVALALKEFWIELEKETPGRLDDDPIGVDEYFQEYDLSAERIYQASDKLRAVGLPPKLSYSRDDESDHTFEVRPREKHFEDFFQFEGDIAARLWGKYFEVDSENEQRSSATDVQSTHHTINPIFRARTDEVIERHGFMLMPFGEEWSDWLYRDIIRDTLEAHDYRIRRADEKQGRVVIEDVWKEICQSEFIIADMAGLNPNVMYELGIVDTVGKPVISLIQGSPGEELPFDLQHYRTITYEPGEGDRLQERLPDMVEGAIESYRDRNPDRQLPVAPAPGARPQTGVFGNPGMM